MDRHELWYEQPAAAWTERLPIGNGTLGAMLDGGPLSSRLLLNDGRAWSGSPANASAEPRIDPHVAQDALTSARALIAGRDFVGADAELRRIQHRYSQSYLPYADIDLTVFGTDNRVSLYRRSLTLDDATHVTSYLLDGKSVVQTTFVSYPHGVLVHTIESINATVDVTVELSTQLRELGRRALSDGTRLELTMKMPSDVAPSHDADQDPITYVDDDRLSLQGAVVVGIEHDGTATVDRGTIIIRDVRRVRLVVATETTFAGIGAWPVGTAADALLTAAHRVDVAMDLPADEVRAAHVDDVSALLGTLAISTGDLLALPTDERLRRGNRHPGGPLAADPALAGLLFAYGRYLLASSSRDGGVPANLQGIWNHSLQAPWSSNYTVNINLQMNYWMAETANLRPCLPPLFELIDALAVLGRTTARELYDAPGWAAHHNTDIWAYTLPVGLGRHDPKWAFWPLAGPWLVRHLWEYAQFGADDAFLRDRAWPVIRSAAEFCLAWLIELPDGSLGTSPSTSPENQFSTPEGAAAAATSSAYDLIVIGDLLDMVATIADRLGFVDAVADAARAARPRLAEVRIGAAGTVQEWADDFDFPDPHHRHIGHLYFVFPGDRPLSERLGDAVSRSLDSRGDESTGWSLAWKIALRARLGEPEKVSDLLRLVFRDMEVDRGPWVGGLYPNLFAAHPPFQIDGNFGFVAGVIECLVQSHTDAIELLPAVPAELSSGTVSGVRARPGIEVSMSWAPGADEVIRPLKVVLRAVHSRAHGTHIVRFHAYETLVVLTDQAVEIDVAMWSPEFVR